MPIIRSTNAPTFDLPDLTVVGLAAPSRGAQETSVWRITLAPGAPGVPHSVDKEEIFVALSGRATVTLGAERFEITAGDTVVVPANQIFSLANPGTEVFQAIAIAPVGVQAHVSGEERFAPPWTV